MIVSKCVYLCVCVCVCACVCVCNLLTHVSYRVHPCGPMVLVVIATAVNLIRYGVIEKFVCPCQSNHSINREKIALLVDRIVH